ncbi:heavy metal-associated isoprenylated plant protein 6-like [Eucalyptus grandis]|uniref:heavy metal-associated isoprenylated plant protein 6-like n=1 Tax=Eucalyptus grandis TaxID=71139 RepID=UPI00192ECF62|nr:heavy metal-associated isoprenylated plant protein 6-like [Eucalyptus grandis]
MAEKKVKMEIKVDLGCSRCYKKIREVIGKLPEIRDQRYDEKQNRVLISVVSCCPERILEKIASKGGKTVESIKIVPEKKDSEKPKETEKKKNVGDEPKEGKTKDARAAGKPEEGKKKKDGGGDKRKGDGEKQQAQGQNIIIIENVNIYQDRRH